MQIIEASRDMAALERFLPAFIDKAASEVSSMAARRRALRRDAAIDPKRLEASSRLLPLAARIPHAFELWIGHLGWLERMSSSVQFTLDDLTTEEARGLALLRHAREKFWQVHSACPRCRTVNVRGASFCGGCGADFGGSEVGS